MKKMLLCLALFALLPMLIVGCNPPQNKNAQKKESGEACSCGHDHSAEGHADHADHDHADHDHGEKAPAGTEEPAATEAPDFVVPPVEPAAETEGSPAPVENAPAE